MTNQHSEVLAVNEAFYRAFEKKDIEAMSALSHLPDINVRGLWLEVGVNFSPETICMEWLSGQRFPAMG